MPPMHQVYRGRKACWGMVAGCRCKTKLRDMGLDIGQGGVLGSMEKWLIAAYTKLGRGLGIVEWKVSLVPPVIL